MLTFNDLGVKLAGLRKYADALGWFDRAIMDDDTLGALFLNRGDCARHSARSPRRAARCALHMHEACGQVPWRACRHVCPTPPARSCTGHRALGSVAEALTDFERAAELHSADPKKQWEIQTRIALVHNERGTQLFNHAAARHAAVEFSRAIECNPRVAHFYINRAQATLELRRYDLARDDILAALKLAPSNLKAQQMLASLSPGT